MPTRIAKIARTTRETDIRLTLNLDGKGKSKIKTTIGFLDHMLESFAKHGLFDLTITATGDTHIDQHHLVEDIGIVLGEAVAQALGDKKGIYRAGFWHGAYLMPMDETLAIAAVDLSGRSHLNFRVRFVTPLVGTLATDVIGEFFEGFTQGARANLYLETKEARSEHHKVEALYKAFARALRMAVEKDARNANVVPSTKGKL